MKTPEEIKKNARTCISQPYTEPCGSCELYPKCRGDVNYNLIALLDLVNECEHRLAQVERERDAAVADLTDDGDCRYCKNIDLSDVCGHGNCCTCNNEECPCCKCDRVNDRFEWRGVCEENTKDDSGAHSQ